jgi:hypothetical protein
VTAHGKWTCSTNEEHWSSGEYFDTREEALAYGMSAFAAEHGIRDGGNVWIGQVKEITPADLAGQGADAWRVIENLDEALFELVGDECDHELDVSKEAEADLDARLEAAIRDWMIAHDIKPKSWTLEHVERHVWKQCDVLRAVPHAAHPDCDDVSERCVLHDEHEGECEWP